MEDKRKSSSSFSLLTFALLSLAFLWAAFRIGLIMTIKSAPPDYTEASHNAWSFLTFCLGVGGLTTAFVQITRVLLPLRGDFHAEALKAWFDASAERWKKTNKADTFEDHLIEPGKPSPAVSSAKAILEFETRGGLHHDFLSSRAASDLYDLPIEQLTAQLSLAAEGGLDEPKRSPNFVRCVLGDAGQDQLAILTREASTATPTGKPPVIKSPADTDTWAEPDLLERAKARAALARLCQLNLDSFQISTGGRWRRKLRLSVTACSLVCSFAITATAHWHNTDELNHKGKVISVVLYSLIEGLIAAYIAMLFRDLTAIVENKRRRP